MWPHHGTPPARTDICSGVDFELTQQRMARLIGEHLAEIGMSQAEFARRTGRTPKHVNQVLTGKSTAAMAQLDYWAFTLGLHFEVTLAKER